MTSPREQSTSSAKDSITDWPCTASSSSASPRPIRATVARVPAGITCTRSPRRTDPWTTIPAKPRRPWRLTHCTGISNGPAAVLRLRAPTASRCSSRVGPSYQGIAGERRGDVVAGQGRDRNGREALPERRIIGDDPVEDGAVVADRVHLVHQQHEAGHAEQPAQIGVAPGLGQHALAGVDEHQGELGGRGAGHQVARILLVPGRVGDDIFAPCPSRRSGRRRRS